MELKITPIVPVGDDTEMDDTTHDVGLIQNPRPTILPTSDPTLIVSEAHWSETGVPTPESQAVSDQGAEEDPDDYQHDPETSDASSATSISGSITLRGPTRVADSAGFHVQRIRSVASPEECLLFREPNFPRSRAGRVSSNEVRSSIAAAALSDSDGIRVKGYGPGFWTAELDSVSAVQKVEGRIAYIRRQAVTLERFVEEHPLVFCSGGLPSDISEASIAGAVLRLFPDNNTFFQRQQLEPSFWRLIVTFDKRTNVEQFSIAFVSQSGTKGKATFSAPQDHWPCKVCRGPHPVIDCPHPRRIAPLGESHLRLMSTAQHNQIRATLRAG